MNEQRSVSETIKPGQIVYLDEQGELKPFLPSDGHCQPIGTAKRDIAKGEVVIYSPGHDTDDIAATVSVASFMMPSELDPKD